ncbi:probable periplasmic serine endoprotease DegP-like [Triticum dicoccoides]|uniref:probable periplasmic serine endoprotease DegP-like n=1 Tax=Triticum dicoccoides TaxID=85692 RepID=UPI0018919A05|nr:probable periplasmic serine endoprotease DegP-like [Triticum dicoccoides]
MVLIYTLYLEKELIQCVGIQLNFSKMVIVHLLDGETAVASLLYLQEHYEFALYEVVVDKPVQLSTFNDNVHSGQDAFRLGRDESLDLRITHGRVEYKIPTRHERGHYMYFSHDEHKSLHDDGGPVIDLDGKVVGMVHNQFKETFLPSSILHKCLDSWRKLKCIPRAHLGMTFTPIKLLDPICIERMRRKHNIASGLLVEQVSKESNAEKLGIRMGDVIERFNGECISNTTELEKMLLDIGGDHFDQAKVLKTETDLRIQIFRATKRCRRVRNLTVTVSDRGEDIIEALSTERARVRGWIREGRAAAWGGGGVRRGALGSGGGGAGRWAAAHILRGGDDDDGFGGG